MFDGKLVSPSLAELEKARETFAEREPRDLFYRAATELVALAWDGKTKLSLAEAVAVLLQTWNISFYRFRGGFDSAHFEELERLLACIRPSLAVYRERRIESVEPGDQRFVVELFEQSELVIGAVGAAKMFHLIAPHFFPIWDRKIAEAYRCRLGKAGSNGQKYFGFMEVTRKQALAIRTMGFLGPDALKALDEYNYCRFTNKWSVT